MIKTSSARFGPRDLYISAAETAMKSFLCDFRSQPRATAALSMSDYFPNRLGSNRTALTRARFHSGGFGADARSTLVPEGEGDEENERNQHRIHDCAIGSASHID
jgi:hypothetical protein